ncbi:hypothetical protein Tco_1322637 [Tanacetum coccineum]
MLVEITPDKEEVVVDAIPLATKPQSLLISRFIKKRRPGRLGNPIEVGKSKTWRNKATGRIYMLVENKYPFTPPTLTDMLNKKLQADHLNEMYHQLLNHYTRQLNNE